jgi:radical SAM superfamily enzyme YgiQ (UPF0313 family)
LRLSRGCPFRCTYCSAPRFGPAYEPRPLDSALAELETLTRRGVRDIAFYDDALLHRADEVLLPFLEEARRRVSGLRFHTPNALHARLLSPAVAETLVRSGFASFYLGFEGGGAAWRETTGGKVSADDLAEAVGNLVRAGADRRHVTAYLLLGHPTTEPGELEEAMRFVRGLGIRQFLAEFSPVPGTPDGDLCARWADLREPLWHDKTAFPVARLGFGEVNRLKGIALEFNREVEGRRAKV